MEQAIPWLASGLGAFGLAHALLRSHPRPGLPAAARPLAVAAVVLVALGALLTLPAEPPFSTGQTLGPGFLVGAIVVLLGMLVGAPSPAGAAVEGAEQFTWSGRLSAATLGVGLLLLPYAGRPLDALAGFALGALCIGLFIGGGLSLIAQRDAADHADTNGLARGAEATALIATALAAATYLATFHRSPMGVREWQALPVLLSGAGALLLAARSAVTAPASRGWLYDVLLVAAPLAVVCWLVATQLGGTAAFLQVALVGLGVFALVGWLDRAAGMRETDSAAGSRLDLALIAALLVLGAAVLAFRELHGYGLALMTLVGFVTRPLAASPERGGPAAGGLYTNALLLSLLLALYRVFIERNEYTRGFQPDFLYYYVALVLGALLPALLAGVAGDTMVRGERADGRHAFSGVARVLLVGAASVSAPLAIWLLIGDRPAAALLVGLAVGAVTLLPRDGTERPDRSRLWRLSALIMALSAVQFTHLLAPLALRTRGQRLSVLAVVAVIALLAVAVTAWQESRWRDAART